MNDTTWGIVAVITAIVGAILTALYQKNKNTTVTPVTPTPSKDQIEAEQKATILADKALAQKEEAQKLVGEERDKKLAEFEQTLQEDTAVLADDSEALNAYLKQVGESIHGR